MSVRDDRKGFVRKNLMRLSWPLLVVTVLTLLAALGNVIVLSIASPELNAAVATANQLLGIVYDVSVLFSIGALVVVAQQLGAGEGTAAARSARTALRAGSLLGVALAMLVIALGPLVLRWINTPEELLGDALVYLWVIAMSLVFNAYIVTATAVLRAYGRTPSILVLAIVVNLVDVLLLGVLVLVLELGVVGAALPSLLVRGLGVLILMGLLRSRTGVTLLRRGGREAGQGSGREPGTGRRSAWTMTRLSLPTVLENGAYNLAIVTTVSLINVLGADAINARSYSLTLTALVTGVILALAQGNETIVGWDVGERSARRARRLTLRTAAGTAAASAALAALLWCFAEPALAAFGASEGIVAMARGALAVSIVLLPLSAATSVVYGALRSAGDVVVPMLYSIAASVLVLLPLAWLLVSRLELGLAGLFWALVGHEAVRAALMTGRWARGSWMRRRPVGAEADGGEASPGREGGAHGDAERAPVRPGHSSSSTATS
jgi:Na+-driven multidrug efflux pump